MCGIAGYLSHEGAASRAVVERMTRVLAHRGPDGEGFHVSGPIGLGHRRLAILDLSPAGSQPMTAASGRLWLTYNGELFNFREIRRELEARGHVFRSRNDAEVVLAAYLEWGRACLSKFNGMFAFGLWDAATEELWLVRDRLGVKPLFYSDQPGALAFASEIKGVLPALPAPPALDEEALHHFLSLNYTPAPRTFFKGVAQLAPGHYLVCGRGRPPRTMRWWSLEPRAESLEDIETRLETLLDDAVRLRLVSDVPVGAFLSSGVDSSAVVAWMQRHVGHPVKTFTARFAEPSYDESPQAGVVARTLGTDHTEQVIGPADLDALPNIVWHSEELTADSSMLAVYRLAERARKEVTVVLTGDGADELFGGYPTYLATRLAGWYRRVPRPVRDRVVRPVVALLPVSERKGSLESRLRRFVNGDVSDVARAHASWRTIFSEEEKRTLLAKGMWPPTASLYEPLLHHAAAWDPVNRLLYADLAFYLPNDMLVKVDRMTMAWALEARTPYLDYRVVELVASLPSRLKCGGGFRNKALLRRVARTVLPRAIHPAPKAGFNIPVFQWLRRERRRFVEEHLLETSPDVLAVLSRREIETLVREHASGVADHGHKLWGLLCLSLWWTRFMEADRS